MDSSAAAPTLASALKTLAMAFIAASIPLLPSVPCSVILVLFGFYRKAPWSPLRLLNINECLYTPLDDGLINKAIIQALSLHSSMSFIYMRLHVALEIKLLLFC